MHNNLKTVVAMMAVSITGLLVNMSKKDYVKKDSCRRRFAKISVMQ